MNKQDLLNRQPPLQGQRQLPAGSSDIARKDSHWLTGVIVSHG